MKTLYAAAPLLFALAGCSMFQQSTEPVIATSFFTLGVPLDSEAGRIKLLVLEYLSENTAKGDPRIRFVPLTEAEIQQVQARFLHRLRPGTQAEYIRGKGAVDKTSREEGIGIEIRDVKLNGEEADVEAGIYTNTTENRYNFRLVKIDQSWRVHDVTPLFMANPATKNLNSWPRPPGRSF